MALNPLILFLSLLISSLSIANSQNPEQEILLQIKEEFKNPPVTESWNTSTTHCNWRGIKCTNFSVTHLNLSYQNIPQSIPDSICRLENLAFLDLSYNDFSDPFPTNLYNCTNLQYLDLSQNYIEGSIPSNINHLSNLIRYLSLSSNNFAGSIPSSIGQLSRLKSLFLDNNSLNGMFPAELGNLSSLELLSLANNPFSPSKIPAEFGNMSSLTCLWMEWTNLHGEIPQSFEKLSELVKLDLAMNSLSGSIPAGIWMLEKLEVIYTWHNKLSGDINKKIKAKSLVEIDISRNNLTGPIPVGFKNLQNLNVLILYANQLSGSIPAEIALLPSLADIRLFSNKLTGILPPELGKHSKLGNLDVTDNSLSGELPRFLCSQGNFSSLAISNNNFTGKLPSSIGSCQTLSYLEVQNNNLYGEVPVGIWSVAVNLTKVIMHHNSLSGAFPRNLPWNLTLLDIEYNGFSGNIPSSAPNLVAFKASNNMFSGVIPAKLDKFSSLQILSLGCNQISGKIPSSISALSSLTELNLSSNSLSGNIPAVIGSLAVLTKIDLSDNMLTGSIPDSMGNMKLNILNLSSNDLSGEVPVSLQNQAYDESFLSNPNLCSSSSLINLRICSQKSSSRELLLLLCALPLLAIISLGLSFILRGYTRRNRSNVVNACTITTFHHLGNFNESDIVKGLTNENLIGRGGGGLVYKITLSNQSRDTVAVKKIRNSARVEKEFQAEVQFLGSIRHANIVKLLCCISSADSKILVYEYVENGSLDMWLHHRCPSSVSGRSASLDWPMRLMIAVGAAKGLCYMHHGCSPPIVHRDVKSSNILLDSDFNAKIGDFGLARMLMKAGEPESVSVVAGSFGYMPPECGWLRKVNEKVDVFSFGVVLLELTTGREVNYVNEHVCLADWVWQRFQEGKSLIDVIDEDIRDSSYIDDILAVIRLGIICTGSLPAHRPSMKEVLRILQGCNQKNAGNRSGPAESNTAPLIRTNSQWGSNRGSSEVEEEGDHGSCS